MNQDRINKLLRQSYAEIQHLRDTHRRLKEARREPLAVVGLACRAPGGVDGPESYWELLRQGGDAVGPLPERWGGEDLYHPDPARSGKCYAQEGGFLSGVEQFDATFFGIAPREATEMDPQQRIALEVAWEALERAGLRPRELRQSNTGVYLGTMGADYGWGEGSLESLSGYRLTGQTSSVLSGRISYTLDLHGPAITVDTACSSSLVALSLACSGLRQQECDLALAGGVQVMSTPITMVEFSRLRALAVDGRCKAFSFDADGVGLAEGAGLVVLKRLSDAQCDGNPILAIIRGAAVNQDGQSQGLTAPSGPSQERVVAQALTNAGLEPEDLDVVEAHGTGTVLGDPIEAEALSAVLGGGERTVWLGSSKSNFGHTQAAGGVLGLIKLVLALIQERLPRTLHAEEPASEVEWSDSGLSLLQAEQIWCRTSNRPRRAGVSAFGVSGTNAHLIVEEAPLGAEAERSLLRAPLLLSGRNKVALRAQARRWSDWLFSHPEVEWSDVLRTAALHRTHFEARAAFAVASAEEAAAALLAFSQGKETPEIGVTQPFLRGLESDSLVFVFSGQGSQWPEMGRALLSESEVFAQAVARCEEAFQPYLDWSVESALKGELPLEQVSVVQPALFTMGVALAEMWRSLGCEPAAVIGHSQGEIVAAVVSGALTLAQGAAVVAHRSRLLGPIAHAGDGGMAAVELALEEVEERLKGWPGLSVAAVNTRSSTVVSGDRKSLQAWLVRLEDESVFCRMVEVDYASHSAQMDIILEELGQELEGLEPRQTTVPMVSTVTGARVRGQELDADYWCRNLREPVRLDLALECVLGSGPCALLEVSPHPVLALPLTKACEEGGLVVGSLQRGQGGLKTLHQGLSELHLGGYPVNWGAIFPSEHGRLAALPTYPFQRERFWLNGAVGPHHRVHSTSQWLYQEQWVPALRQRPRAAATETLWLIADGGQGTGAFLQEALEAGGESRIERGTVAETSTRLASLKADGSPPVRLMVLYLPGAPDSPAGYEPQVVEALSLAKAASSGSSGPSNIRLWLLTRGALSAEGGCSGLRALWGFGRSLALTRASIYGGLFDLPPGDPEASTLGLLTEFLRTTSPKEGDEFKLRGTELWTRRLQRVNVEEKEGAAWRPQGTILLTGGTGHIGSQVATWLAEQGATRLVIPTRGDLDSGSARKLGEALERRGCSVEFVSCDVGDSPSVGRLVAHLARQSSKPLLQIFHTAGSVSQLELDELTPAKMVAEMAAKARGAWSLHDAVQRLNVNLDSFVLFGSISGFWGSRSPAYSAANAALAGLVAHRRAQGLPATVLHWGIWEGGGAGAEGVSHHFQKRGLRQLPASSALEALRLAMDRGSEALAIVDIDWEPFALTMASARPKPFLSSLPEVRAALEEKNISQTPAGEWDALSEEARMPWLLSLVQKEAAQVLGLSGPEMVPSGRPLQELGLDSLMAVELRGRLRMRTNCKLPTTLVFDYPDPEALASFLLREWGGEQQAGIPRAPLSDTEEAVAVIGMACRLPGGVEDLAGYWELLGRGGDVVGPLPLRWQDELSRGLDDVREGGFLDQAEGFDAAFFRISSREALNMDPEQRLFLEAAWEALEHSGICPDKLGGSPVGVFCGSQGSDYARQGSTSSQRLLGLAGSVLSGRLSYLLDLQGPAITVDTACSSSLVAVHLARNGLCQGECDLALAGGVQVMSTPATLRELGRMSGLAASDGRCKAFASGADGAGFAEGVGVLVLQGLGAALREGNKVLAVLPGSAVNQDGRSQGLTAPNGPSQERVIRRALAVSQLGPSDIDAVEAHGTGTRLGDTIEAEALARVFGPERDPKSPLWVGSSKSNFGHAQAAAGVLGLIKLVLALIHERLPRTLHAEQPSALVEWETSGLALLGQDRLWNSAPNRLRRAGVSAFGISGTNAHVVVQEAPAEDAASASRGSHSLDGPEVLPLVLSGCTPQALSSNAARLAGYLESREVGLEDLAFSLATTRTAFSFRRALLARRDDAADGYPKLLADLRSSTLAGRETGALVMLFPGQGSQYVGMGQGLYRKPGMEIFTEAFDAAASAIESVWGDGTTLKSRMWEGRWVESTRYAQPALFALETALFRQWEGWGVEPRLLLGHSVGEFAVAHVSGILSLQDAAALVCARGELMDELASEGGMMASVQCTEEEASAAIGRLPGSLRMGAEIAALNGPTQTVVSGATESILSLMEQFKRMGRRVRELERGQAFHSRRMDAVLESFREVASSKIVYSPSQFPIISSVSGELADFQVGDFVSAEYWVQQLRRTVRFAAGVQAALGLGGETFLECGPRAGLCGLVAEFGSAVPSLRSLEEELPSLCSALGRLHVHHQPVDWERVFMSLGASKVELPTYAFQRRNYWLGGPAGPPRSRLFCLHRAPLPFPKTELREVPWRRLGDRGALEGTEVILDLREHGRSPAQLTAEVMGQVQGWLESEELERLTVVTSGAIGGAKGDLAGAAVWGLCRSLRLEHPEVEVHLFDGDGELEAGLVGCYAEAILQEGELFCQDFAPVQLGEGASPEWSDGTVLITGATGGLGRALAHHLVSVHGVRHLKLLSRSGAKGAPELEAGLLEAGATSVSVVACDVADRASLERRLKEIPQQTPLVAIFHLAGVLRDGVFRGQSEVGVREVFAGKVEGALHLHELTLNCGSLVEFVLFSSLSGVLGSAGQANYAAANACLDRLASYRRELGLPATSIAWGPWVEGMTKNLSPRDLSRLGSESLSVAEGLSVLSQALGREEAVLAVMLPAEVSQAGEVAASRKLRDELARVEEDERLPRLVEFVRREVAEVLGVGSVEKIPPERPIQELGLDSLMAIELRNRLMEKCELRLPTTLVYDYPEPEGVACFLLEEMSGFRRWSNDEVHRKLRSVSIEALRESGILEAFMAIPEGVVEEADELRQQISEAGEDELMGLAERLLGVQRDPRDL